MRSLPWILLGASLLANVLLWTHRAERTPAEEPVRRESGGSSAPPSEATLRDDPEERIADLERALAASEERLRAFDGVTPVDLAVLGGRDLGTKLRAIAALPEEYRPSAIRKLSELLRENPALKRDAIHVLLDEPDPAILVVLGSLARSEAPLDRRSAPDIESVATVLRQGQPAERRVAAALFLTLEIAKPALLEAIRSDPDSDVVAAVGERTASAGELRSELHAAVERLPEGKGRRDLVVTLARAEHVASDGAGLYEWWKRAEPPSRREDVAHAFATFSGSFALFRSKDGDKRRDTATFQTRVLDVYRNTNDLSTRRALARGSWFIVDDEYPWKSDFVRRLAEVEPDPSLRDRLLRAASLIETRRNEGQGLGSQDLDPILEGR